MSPWYGDHRSVAKALIVLQRLDSANVLLNDAHAVLDEDMPDWLRIRLRLVRTEVGHIAEDVRQSLGLARPRGPRAGAL